MEVSATPLFSMFISKTCKQMIWPPPSSPGIFSFLELNMATVNVSFNRSGLARIKTKQQPQLKKKLLIDTLIWNKVPELNACFSLIKKLLEVLKDCQGLEVIPGH